MTLAKQIEGDQERRLTDKPKNSLQAVPGPAWCDTYLDAEGMVCQRWRAAAPAEAVLLASPEGNPNHPSYGPKLFGYDQAEFLRKQYR